jgi:hypothetical protein
VGTSHKTDAGTPGTERVIAFSQLAVKGLIAFCGASSTIQQWDAEDNNFLHGIDGIPTLFQLDYDEFMQGYGQSCIT